MDLDYTNLEISIELSSNLNHEQTPIAGASSVPQDESRGLNEMTPEDLDSLKKQVCEYARKDNWKEAESIFNKYPDMVRIPLTNNEDRAIHVAVDANSITFVKGLLNLMTPQDWQIQNRWGYTASLMAGKSGINSDLVQIFIKRIQDLDSLKELVCEYARNDKWKKAESIFNKYAYMVRIPLTASGDTALHVAVSANSITFVKGLVNLMTPQDCQIRNGQGYTAFLMAAKSGNSDLVQIMIEKNQDLDSLKELVYEYAFQDRWKEAESIFNKYADMVRIPLTASGDTALHVGVIANSITFVKGLVNLMTPQDWQIQNSDGHKAFLMAAELGNSDLVQIMTSSTLLKKMDIKDIEELFFRTIEHDMFGSARKIYEAYPYLLPINGTNPLAGARDGRALTMLLRKPFERRASEDSLEFIKRIWSQLERQSGWKGILELIGSSSLVSAMADALESGNVEAVEWLLFTNPELLKLKDDSKGQNILHYAVQQRHSSTVSSIFKMVSPNHVLRLRTVDVTPMLRTVDGDGNNILHLAAYFLKKEENSSSLKATTKMRREVAWFKQVEKNAPPELRTKRNKKGKKPKDVFHDEHKELSKEVKDTAKGIADSGMLVAALVATVAFAAALVVPGDKTNLWFIVFILANAAALFTSSASILCFLSNFITSRFADSEFVTALHPSLILGPMLLLISVVTMIISFAAASFLIFEHTSKRVAYVVTSMGGFPILLFLLFQISIFDTFIWSRFYRMSYAQ